MKKFLFLHNENVKKQLREFNNIGIVKILANTFKYFLPINYRCAVLKTKIQFGTLHFHKKIFSLRKQVSSDIPRYKIFTDSYFTDNTNFQIDGNNEIKQVSP